MRSRTCAWLAIAALGGTPTQAGAGTDYGDAWAPYPVTRTDAGAAHVLVSGWHLGAIVDAETNGIPSTLADGDDANGTPDDEDGIRVAWGGRYQPLDAMRTFIPGSSYELGVVTSTNGYLNAWIDFNADGDWADEGDAIAPGVAVVGGTNSLALHIPATASNTWVCGRFRFSSVPVLAFGGPPAPNGEVEDHRVLLRKLPPMVTLDFGDAPAPYPTSLAQDGARHRPSAVWRLGTTTDSETDGQPSDDARGDDVNGTTDDEDGVFLMYAGSSLPFDTAPTLVKGGIYTLAVVVGPSNGYLNAWVDFDRDGDWTDAGEHVADDRVLVTGTNTVPLLIPAGASNGTTFARFRFSAQAGLSCTGLADYGEVEDYRLALTGSMDFGDAPAPYPVTVTDDGARHAPVAGWFLGNRADAETNGLQSADANGDDLDGETDDEDGVLGPMGPAGYLPLGTRTPMQTGVLQALRIIASTNGYLNAWLDLDGNGSWEDGGEQVAVAVPMGRGTNALPVHVPSTATTGRSCARFRFGSTQTLACTGMAKDGEVEDYAIDLVPHENGPLVDFGDAPVPYPVLGSLGGAVHAIVPGWHLGSMVDAETDGLQTPIANGDDAFGETSDEDGVFVKWAGGYRRLSEAEGFLAGSRFTLAVVASTGGYLNAWMDFNRNGNWGDAGEQIAQAAMLSRGTNLLTLNVPATAGNGPSFARFRFSKQSGLGYSGYAAEGEVEDYAMRIVRESPGTAMDYGDARNPYPVLRAQNGARHLTADGWWMGVRVDTESDGQPDMEAKKDDNTGGPDDEEGVWVRRPGGNIFYRLDAEALKVSPSPYTLGVVASTNGYVSAWVDFNADGDWADTGEQIASDWSVAAGTNTMPLWLPSSVTSCTTAARFRFSAQPGLSCTGLAVNGEVEDHSFRMYNLLDFGDAPDGYGTTLAANGARHMLQAFTTNGTLVLGRYRLGANWDWETDGQPGDMADVDDSTGTADDEDGVYVWAVEPNQALDKAGPLLANNDYALKIVTSTGGYLNAWFDFNADSDWDDAGEQVCTDAVLQAGTNTLALHIPLSASNGTTYARFRFDSRGGLTPTGLAEDGEVEDYRVSIERRIDFGDAPWGYPVQTSDDGARHVVSLGRMLGWAVDGEPNGQWSDMADSDDKGGWPDDEDGVYVWAVEMGQALDKAGPLLANNDYALKIVASTGGYLNAWFDFNADSDWDDDGEQVCKDALLQAGTNTVALHIPLNASSGNTCARFRFDSRGGLTPTGPAEDGEVEDYRVSIERRIDFGDAPHGYPVQTSDDGARHVVSLGRMLGWAVDGEMDGQNSITEWDDANATPDDEDGVYVWAVEPNLALDRFECLNANNDYVLMVVASTGGFLNAWMDFNGDSDWNDEGEQICMDAVLVRGTNALPLHIPAAAVGGRSRFRFDSRGGLLPTGLAEDGEVEDYAACVLQSMDFGDAACGYPVSMSGDGARHLVVRGRMLGRAVDAESDGMCSYDANSDDSRGTPPDEDGVYVWAYGSDLPLNGFSTLNANNDYVLKVIASTGGYLNAWFDWNTDWDWNDAGEQIFTNTVLQTGTNTLILHISASASTGYAYARFRFDSRGGLAPTGLAEDGEVEDYRVELARVVDFGDAPSSYPVALSQDGARHLVVNGRHLGWAVDGEASDPPSSCCALQDDVMGLPDDEDGVYVGSVAQHLELNQYGPLLANNDYTLAVVASTGGYLNAWMDFNADGDWDDEGEHLYRDVTLTCGTNALRLHVPVSVTNGGSYARFRFDSCGGLMQGGLAADGEVEDYYIEFARRMDFGDAPAPYPTLEAANGARHLAVTAWRLGMELDAEADGQPRSDARADDQGGGPDDEDGVYVAWGGAHLPLDSFDGFQAHADYVLELGASTSGYLNAWVDFNADGDWDDAGEQISADTPLVHGPNALPLRVPSTASNGTTYARFRFDSRGGLSPTGLAEDGEVEDYLVTIKEPLKLVSFAAGGDALLRIEWNDAGLYYTVEQTTNLTGQWTPVPGSWPAPGSSWSLYELPRLTPVFYRVRGEPSR